MKKIYISNIMIDKVRHLENINIPMSMDKMKHLIITGKNGSGKTSLLDAIAKFFDSIVCSSESIENMQLLLEGGQNLQGYIDFENEDESKRARRIMEYYKVLTGNSAGKVSLKMNCQLEEVRSLFKEGKFIVAYYKAERMFKAKVPKHVEKVELKDSYLIEESPRDEFIQYLLDLKMTEALARANGKTEKAVRIRRWFEELQELLKEVIEDNSVRLIFDEDSFKFTIYMDGREPFDFNTLSSGFSAILEIVVDIMFRMEKQTNKVFNYSLPGIVLIDEIETHLHLELQKKIMNLLTKVFPNIQFIVTTHSPFILNSLDDAVIYDLEKKLFVSEGMTGFTYTSIVEGYFDADVMSDTLETKFNRYKELVYKSDLSDDKSRAYFPGSGITSY